MKTISEEYPELLNKAHKELNTPAQLSKLGSKAVESSSKIWWTCDVYPEHVWFASIRSRAFNQQGCQICDDKIAYAGFNDLATKKPKLAEQWHPTKNNELTPQQVTYKTDRKVWWECEKGHYYEMSVNDRAVRGRGCSVCRGLKILVGVTDLGSTHPDVASEWHPTKNGDLTPEQVTAGAHTNVWWLGKECGHEWQMIVYRRTQERGQNCSVCAGKVTLPSTSFATTNPEIASEWHPTLNGELTPEQFLAGSHEKVWWLGKECGHEWDGIIKSRTLSKHGCPVCAGKRVISNINSLTHIFPLIASEWHPTLNGEFTPEQVSSVSGKKVWWQCNAKQHVWRTSVGNRTGLKSGCPDCIPQVSVAEQELFDYVISLGFTPVRDRTVLGRQELDIYVEEKKFAIEFNGLYWHSEAAGKTETYHYDKWKACKDKGISLFQIWEDDYRMNPDLIKRMVAHKLGVKTEKSIQAKKTEFKKVSIPDAQAFLTENHLQGYRVAKNFGLYYEDQLVALLSVAAKGSSMEIIRFSTSRGIYGGFSKLLKNILADELFQNVKEVTSYSHNDHASGGMYEQAGFTLKHTGKPGYAYLVNGTRVHRLQYTKKRFREDPNLEYEEGLSERELAELNGLTRIWDAGSSLWVKSLD